MRATTDSPGTPHKPSGKRKATSIDEPPSSPPPALVEVPRKLAEEVAAVEVALRTALYMANLRWANLRSNSDAAPPGTSVGGNEVGREDMLLEGALYRASLRRTSLRSNPDAAPPGTSVGGNDVG